MSTDIVERETAVFKPNTLYNPETFDPLEWLPEDLHKWHEHVRWFVHKLYARRVFDRRDPDAFIHLKMAYLRRVLPFRHTKRLIEALARSSLIDWDRRYVVDVESRKYRLCKELRQVIHRRYEVKSDSLNKKLDNLRAEKSKEIRLDVHQHLWRYLQEITILDQARSASENDEQAMSVHAIQDGMWHMTPGDDYGRVHTNLTNLHTPLRDWLRWKGKTLVNLDVRNSQPLLFSILLLNWYQNGGFLAPVNQFSVEEMYQEIPDGLITGGIDRVQECDSSPFPSPSHTLYDVTLSSSTKHLPEDVRRYIYLCQDGEFYDTLMAQADVPASMRREWKREFFGKVFFCRNSSLYPEQALFSGMFPNVWKVVKALKKDDHSQLSKMLQRVESSLVINRIVRRLMQEHPDTFVTTIHDSLVVPESEAEIALYIMRQEFGRIGLRPKIEPSVLKAA